jgi:hypothetical protein
VDAVNTEPEELLVFGEDGDAISAANASLARESFETFRRTIRSPI